MKNTVNFRIAIAALLFAICAVGLSAQESSDHGAADARTANLEQHIDALSSKIDTMRQQLQESQNEMEAMRAELGSLRSQLAEKNQTADTEHAVTALRADVQQLQERSDVVEAEVQQHDQTKVETASKFPMRLYGTLLFTSLAVNGQTDNLDVPIVALPQMPDSPSGSLSATARQSILGLDASGPHFWGATSSANISVDFFGGIPYADYDTAAGTVRLRTAHATLAWPNRSLSAAFEQPILSPREPTSWLSVGEPALAWSGNLWTWSPQLEFTESNLLRRGHTTARFAFIDPATPGTYGATGLRAADPSESSRQPGYEGHLGYEDSWRGHTVDFGAGGYYSRQAYGYDLHADAWAGTADWKVALARAVELSGEFYRGRGIGGLGGGVFKDYATYGSYTSFRDLDDEGGWGQVKLMLTPRLEANLAMGQDNGFASELRTSDEATAQDAYASLARNQTAYGNLVFRPRQYILFSTEYREIHSWPIAGDENRDRIVGLAAGYLF
jgi:regulator of replication initiation timing